MVSGTSLESHMTKISKTMLQLAQAHEKIASTQQQNHQDQWLMSSSNKQLLLKL